MEFPSPLIPGRLMRRYKRFLADVELADGSLVTAHVPNPGAMLGVDMAGLTVWLSRSESPTRKLPHTLELVEVEDPVAGEPVIVGVNTSHPNRLVAEALAAGSIPELAGYATVRPEVKYGQASRVDFLLEHPDRPRCWLEVKNVHLHRAGGLAEFPDCVAARSTRHLRELQAMVAAGDRAAVLFVVQRGDCDAFAACHDLDPAFAAALDEAAKAGVEVMAYRCEMSRATIRLDRPLAWARA